MPQDFTTYIMLAVLAVLVIFMFRNSRKRQRAQAELREKIVPGVEVMTNFGMYGTLLSLDAENNTAMIETSPGTVIKVHSQTVSRVIEPSAAETGPVATTQDESAAISGAEPEFGERVVPESDKRARKSTEKAAE
ncbi:MAG: preprotein translocase subunit YajC [Microbacteriaceae bacterium]